MSDGRGVRSRDVRISLRFFCLLPARRLPFYRRGRQLVRGAAFHRPPSDRVWSRWAVVRMMTKNSSQPAAKVLVGGAGVL